MLQYTKYVCVCASVCVYAVFPGHWIFISFLTICFRAALLLLL